jgi:hypothetical protein
MRITANRLDEWAKTIAAQSELPRLIRRLLHGSAHITSVAVPAGESTTQAGWDGEVISDTRNAWVPIGRSFWEFSCRVDVTTKANEDFDKRTTQTAEVVQSSAVFVFATPRRWPGKATWLAAKRAQGSWADVRAYDANDLEQWLEQAPAVRLQFAEELGLSGPGTESVDHYWRTWAAQTREEITTTAILTGRDDIKAQLATRLTTSNQSISEPLSIQADSVEEAVAFACACIIGELSLSNHTVVVTAIDGWRFVEGNTGITIAVAARPEYAERPTKRPNLKVIIPFAAGDVSGHFRGAASLDERADFSLERLEHDQFEKALIDIGIDHGDAERLSRATGRSWSVFVRQRSRNPALHTPRWLNLPQSHALATMCLVGGWSTENKADQAIVEQIAGRPYHEMEGDFSVLSAAEDAPVMRIDRVWKAKSPIELLALFGPQMTSSELDRFFSALRSILIEPDPELELPPDERYAAQIHGKVRPQSGLLIRSLCDTLIKIAVRGVDIPGLQHLQLQERAAAFVRNILNSANTSRWLSLSSLLRPLAEAAPDDFLKAIERSLSAPDQPVTALIRETGSSAMFGRCYHADLLWALELLAWAPERLTRVACILAQLSTIPIKGNWGNAPQRSLLNLYRSWLPQTSATIEQRIASLDRLIGAHPDAAFALVDSLVHTYGDMAMPSMRPRWRDDDAGSGRGVPSYERHKMLVEAAERMLSLAVDNASRAVTLIEKISIFDSSRVALPTLQITTGRLFARHYVSTSTVPETMADLRGQRLKVTCVL